MTESIEALSAFNMKQSAGAMAATEASVRNAMVTTLIVTVAGW
ncbi:MAG: hypothetical protein RR101_08485 [Burkholderiaceae bacterium]